MNLLFNTNTVSLLKSKTGLIILLTYFSLFTFLGCAQRVYKPKFSSMQFNRQFVDFPIEKIALLPRGIGDDNFTFLLNTVFLSFRHDIMERSNLEKVIKEQNISLSGLLQSEDYNVIGKLANIDAIVLCSYDYLQGSSITMISVRTGQIIYTVSSLHGYGTDMSNVVYDIAWAMSEGYKRWTDVVFGGGMIGFYLGRIMVEAGAYKGEYIIIKEIATDTPAYYAGLKVGDIILEINGYSIKNNLRLFYKELYGAAGKKIDLIINRNGSMIKFHLLKEPAKR